MDIKLNDNFELTKSKTGDAPVTTNETESLLQDIRMESLTQEGELFYDESFGWSLLDFIQSERNDLDEIELKARIREKLASREEIDSDKIQVDVETAGDILMLKIIFSLLTKEQYELEINLNRVEVSIT